MLIDTRDVKKQINFVKIVINKMYPLSLHFLRKPTSTLITRWWEVFFVDSSKWMEH